MGKQEPGHAGSEGPRPAGKCRTDEGRARGRAVTSLLRLQEPNRYWVPGAVGQESGLCLIMCSVPPARAWHGWRTLVLAETREAFKNRMRLITQTTRVPRARL